MELDSNEYLEELRGFSDSHVNYILFRTSKGKYAEFGNPKQGNEFRFKVPKGSHIFSLKFGFSPVALKFIEVTLAPVAYMPSVAVPVPVSEPFQGIPRIIRRTEYIGSENNTGTVTDDFFAFNLHPLVREGQVKILQINALYARTLLGLQVIYQASDEVKKSEYNFNLSRFENATHSSIEISDSDYITEIATLSDNRYITCLSVGTAQRKHWLCGHQGKGERLNSVTPSGCQVLAFRGMFDADGVQALMVYYI